MKVWLVLVVVYAACYFGRADRPQGDGAKPMHAPRAASAIAWTVTATTGRIDARDVVEVAATRAERPVIAMLGGAIVTVHGTATLASGSVGITDGEVIDAVEYPDGRDVTEVRTLGGEHHVIPRGTAHYSTRWYDLAPGVLSLTRESTQATFARFDTGSDLPTWTATAAQPGLDSIAVVGWLDDNHVAVALARTTAVELVALDLSDGARRTIATLTAGVVVTAPRAGAFAALAADGKLEMRSLSDGRITSTSQLPATFAAAAPPHGTRALGFDGRIVWRHDYNPAHASDVLGTRAATSCHYVAFDATTGEQRPPGAEWVELATDCRVRALLPALDGGAIAVVVLDAHRVRVVKFRRPP